MQKLIYVINAYIALIIYIFSKSKKNIWLIGGHNGMLYTDNSKVFYEYILDEHKEINIYWIIDKKSSINTQIRGEKIIKGSIKNYLYFYNSQVNLFSDTFNSDIAPLAFILPCIRAIYFKRYKVFLNHGRIAFNKVPTFSYLVQKIKDSIYKSYDLATASTKLEKLAMVGNGIKEENIEITGSARDDKLYNIKTKEQSILISPSWRGWLYENHSLKDTQYFDNYTKLLSDKKLNSYLKKNNIQIYFYLHHMFHKFYDEFKEYDNNQIKILEKDSELSQYIKTSNLLITDYSSVCADFYYLKKPVIFFQFDKDEYSKKIGSYINLKNDKFGEIGYNSSDIIDILIKTIERDYIISPSQENGEKFFINFIDKDNCKRIYNTIKERKGIQ